MKNVDSVVSGKSRLSLAKYAVAGLVLSVVVGCASFGGGTPEEAVKARANERWGAWIKRDYAKAYRYNTKGYKATVSEERFSTLRGKDARVLKAEVVDVKCERTDKCDATIRLTATATIMMRQGFPKYIETDTSETWILEDGQWWIFERI